MPLKKAEVSTSRDAANEPWKEFRVGERRMLLKREVVLKTAAHLFLERGYQKTSMSLLSTRLKITKPALYYYFRNKEELLVECYRLGIDEIQNHLEKASPTAGTGLVRLRLYVHGYAISVLSHEFGRCVAMIDDSELSVDTRRGVRELKRAIDSTIRNLVEIGIEDGSIRASSPKMISFAVAGAINWAGTWYRPSGEMSPEAIAQAFTDVLTGGLAPMQTPGK